MLRYLRVGPHSVARPALFLDRDGVLNRRKIGGYVTDPSELELLDLALDSARTAQEIGAAIVVVTNQGCIGRGHATESEVMAVHATLLNALADLGISLDAIYACPHHPLALDSTQRKCNCRKPNPGLIQAAVNDLNIDLRFSILIGDQPSDTAAARAAGIPVDRAISIDETHKEEIAEIVRNALTIP